MYGFNPTAGPITWGESLQELDCMSSEAVVLDVLWGGNRELTGRQFSVVEPNLFVSAPAQTFKKFRLRQQPWNYLLSQILC